MCHKKKKSVTLPQNDLLTFPLEYRLICFKQQRFNKVLVFTNYALNIIPDAVFKKKLWSPLDFHYSEYKQTSY